MIVNFLKLQKEQDKPYNIGDYNLGHLFYEFLIYYGFSFDPKEIYKNMDNIFSRSFFPHSDLIIIDPLNHSNNVGKNTRQLNNIKLAFSLAAFAAREQCECGCHYETESYTECTKIEHCILKRIFNAVKRYSFEETY